MCKVDSCTRQLVCRGLCSRHYYRLLRYGDPTVPDRRILHGLTGHPLHGVWQGMLRRCRDRRTNNFTRYGGRGVTVTAVWAEDFTAFYAWAVTAGYAPGLQLDRIDNDGNYSPENCQWVTPSANSRNKRNNVWITAFGETKVLSDWAKDPRCAVERRVLRQRMVRDGWPAERAIAEAPRAAA